MDGKGLGQGCEEAAADDGILHFGHLLSGGEILPQQLPLSCFWSPEKTLAGAVLATALVEIRDHSDDPKRSRVVAEELAWIRSDANDRLYSFLRICELLNLDPEWVRAIAVRWHEAGRRLRPHLMWRAA